MSTTTATVSIIDELDKVSYIDIEDIQNLIKDKTLSFLSPDYYIRRTTPDYDKKLRELVCTTNDDESKGEPVFKVQKPIVIRRLTNGTFEIVDGNTRVRTLIQSASDTRPLNSIFDSKNKSGSKINSIFVDEIPYVVETISDDELIKYQIISNDSTEPHAIYDKAKAVMKLYDINVEKYGEKSANVITLRETGISGSSMTHYKHSLRFAEEIPLAEELLNSGVIVVRVFYDLINGLIKLRYPKDDDLQVITKGLNDLNNSRKADELPTITNKMVKEYVKNFKQESLTGEPSTDGFPVIITLAWLTENGYVNEALIPDVENLIDEHDEQKLCERIKYKVDDARRDNPDAILTGELLAQAVELTKLEAKGNQTTTVVKKYTHEEFKNTTNKTINEIEGFTSFLGSGNFKEHHFKAVKQSNLVGEVCTRLKKRLQLSTQGEMENILPKLLAILTEVTPDDEAVMGEKTEKNIPFFVGSNGNISTKLDTVLKATPSVPKEKKGGNSEVEKI